MTSPLLKIFPQPLRRANTWAMLASVGAHGVLLGGLIQLPTTGTPSASNRLRVVQLIPLPPQPPPSNQPVAVAPSQPTAVPPIEVLPTVLSNKPRNQPPAIPEATSSSTPAAQPNPQVSPVPGQPQVATSSQSPQLLEPQLTPEQLKQQNQRLQTLQRQPSPAPLNAKVNPVPPPLPLQERNEPMPAEFFAAAKVLGYVPVENGALGSPIQGTYQVEVGSDGTPGQPRQGVASIPELNKLALASIAKHYKPSKTGQPYRAVFQFSLVYKPESEPNIQSPLRPDSLNPDPGASNPSPAPQQPTRLNGNAEVVQPLDEDFLPNLKADPQSPLDLGLDGPSG